MLKDKMKQDLRPIVNLEISILSIQLSLTLVRKDLKEKVKIPILIRQAPIK